MLDDRLAGINDEQQKLMELPIEPILVTAPPGCGKTEALALRAAGLIHNYYVRPPCKILGLTFSNKARDNLRERLDQRLGSLKSRRFLSVHNFHGFAARLLHAHRNVIGLPDVIEMPDRRWVDTQLAEMGVELGNRPEPKGVIRRAKQTYLDDCEVADAIERSGNDIAIELERRRLAFQRLDFDDLIRYGVRLLRCERVRQLYRAHFSAVLIDEMQDMTPQQLELGLLVGHGRMTLVGDISQGIYSFAGADPEVVMDRFLEEDPTLCNLTINYRSAPVILKIVNAISKAIGGGGTLRAPSENSFGAGEVRILRFSSAPDEAQDVLDMVSRLLATDQTLTVGVMTRSNFRRQWIEDLATQREMKFECWDRLVDSHHVRTVLQKASLAIPKSGTLGDRLAILRETALAACEPDDVDLYDGVLAGMDVIESLTSGQLSINDAVATISVRSHEVVAPGLHFLNAHLGKGQQFDWVIVLGMEDGMIPSYMAQTEAERAEEFRVLHVMCSRAIRGLIFTVARDVRWDLKIEWIREESPWLGPVEKYTTGEGDPTLDA